MGIRYSAEKHLIKTIKSLNEEVKAGKDLIDFSKEVEIKKVKVPAKTKEKEKQNLLSLDKKDLEVVKKLKEKVLKSTIKQEKPNVVKVDKKTSKSKVAHEKGISWQKM